MDFDLMDNGKAIKDFIKSSISTPLQYLCLRQEKTGKFINDDTKLLKFGPIFTLDLVLTSNDPEKFPIKAKRRLRRIETKESDVLSVSVTDEEGKVKIVDVEIQVQQSYKPFLGGFRHLKTGVEFHHAVSQTVQGSKKDWNQYLENTSIKAVQTVPIRNAFQQTDVDKGTQTASSGFHVCKGQDVEIEGDSNRYVSSGNYRIKQIAAIVKIQRLFRKFSHEKKLIREEAQKELECQSLEILDFEDEEFDLE